MNIGVIFAGGSGKRMNSKSRPKQFLELNGKPIIIYTIELFDNHPEIDGIVVVCIEPWIPYLKKMLRKFEINKVMDVVPGGETGQKSIFNGLCASEKIAHANNDDNCIVLVHDGVRPLITEETISKNLETVKEKGNCITIAPATETIFVIKDEEEIEISNREKTRMARAPQSFFLKDIMAAHRKSLMEEREFIDSCSMMNHYGCKLALVEGPTENIKITTPSDFFIFRAMVEVRENQQIFGF